MSDSFSPASAIAFSAASACSWICDMLGMTPSSVVSAAPTTATWFLRMALSLRRTEQGKGDLVVELLELDLHLHVEFERFRRLRTIDDVGHHPRAFVELDDSNGVWGREARRGGSMVDDIGIELALAARLEDGDVARGAGGTKRPRRKIDIGAGVAALQAEFALARAVPEMLGFRRRFWFRAGGLGHVVHSSRECCELDATFDQWPSTGPSAPRACRVFRHVHNG